MEKTIDSVARQITHSIEQMQLSLESFVQQEQRYFDTLINSSSGKTKDRIEDRLSILFPNPKAYIITNNTYQPLLTQTINQTKPNPHLFSTGSSTMQLTACNNHYGYIELSTHWSSISQQGLFILCESLDSLKDLLAFNKGEHFNLYLLHGQTGETLANEFSLDDSFDETKLLSVQLIPGSPWKLAAVPNKSIWKSNIISALRNAGLAYFIFFAFSFILLYSIIVIDRKRRNAELAWHALHQRAHATLASIGDGVVVTSTEKIIEYMNPVAEKITGCTIEQAAGRPLQHICPVVTEALSVTPEQDSPNTGELELPSRNRANLFRNNQDYVIEQSATLLTTENNLKPGIVWVLRDVTDNQKTLGELKSSEKRYRVLAENIKDVIWTVDLNLDVTYLSPSIETLLGYPMSIYQSEERIKLFIGNSMDKLVLTCRKLLKRGQQNNPNKKTTMEIEVRHRSGQPIWLEMNMSVMFDSKNKPIGILGLARDCTARKLSESELKLSAIVFENSFEGIMITDAKGHIIRVNKAFTKITGYKPNEIHGQNASILQSGRHNDDFFKQLWKSIATQGYWHGEIWNKRKSGDLYPQRLSISVIKNKEGRILNYIGIFADITEKKQTEERIHRLAYYDELTELPNRVLFHERLKRALVYAKRNNHCVALIFIDLDRFKSINDSLGHPAGDYLLQLTAERLKTCVRESDTVVRMGGDEFTLILVNQPKEQAKMGAQKVAQKTLDILSQPFSIAGREVFIGASIGIAIYPDDANHATMLLKNSDLALYHAKSVGKNNYQFYSEDMNRKVIGRIDMENDLRKAIQNNQLRMYYQPQACIETGKICGIESLVRWYSPQRGIILPSDFIPLAEESELIQTIGEWTILASCQQTAEWLNAGYDVPKMSVNISARQITQPKLVNVISDILDKTGLDPHLLDIELTESILIEDIDTTVDNINMLKSMGLSISIDDFGTGYSSLNYLKRFPIDTLKIDRTFVRDITLDHNDAEVIAAIIAIAQSLNLNIIAEGVETWAQLEFLRFHKCNMAQGYLISKPLSKLSMTQLLESGNVPFSQTEQQDIAV